MEYEQIPLTEELGTVLREHRKDSSAEWVFVQPSGRQKGRPYTENRGFPQRLCKKAGVKEFGCHAIRHLTASILAKNNVPMVAIQQILRHKRLPTTERYVRGLEPVRVHLEVLQNGFSRKKPNDNPINEKRVTA